MTKTILRVSLLLCSLLIAEFSYCDETFSSSSQTLEGLGNSNPTVPSFCTTLPKLAQSAKWSLSKWNDDTADFIVVDKTRRLLHLLTYDRTLIRTYKIALGKSPTGKKTCNGDNRTPEGVYDIGYKNSASDYHLSLAVNYPAQRDINRARKTGCDPGGDIMIHGLPNSKFKRAFIRHPNDWTRGCMAVTNEEIEEIWDLVDRGTKIEICP